MYDLLDDVLALADRSDEAIVCVLNKIEQGPETVSFGRATQVLLIATEEGSQHEEKFDLHLVRQLVLLIAP